MNYNSLLIDLINKRKISIINNEKYVKLTNLLNKINNILVDFSKISEIDDEDIKLFEDPEAKKYIAGIEYFYNRGNIHDKNEIKEAINWLKNKIIYIIENDEQLNKIKQDIINYDRMLEKINNNIFDETMFDFIKECYYNKLINIETAIKLNLYISQNAVKNSVDEQEEVVVLEENEKYILEDLKTLFLKYGYNYDTLNLNKKIREKIEKYGKLEYIDFVLQILRQNNITSENFEDRQSVITNIIIYQDRETLAEINKFINENNCTLMNMFEMSNIFHRRKKVFKFKDSKPGGPSPSKESVTGAYESFVKNIELYKKYNKLPEDYKMSKEDFENRTLYFITPHEKVLNNFAILELYGILPKGEFPRNCSMLSSANMQYLIDRFIEAGLYDYCKKNLSSLELESKNFRWYKIKRAIDKKETLFRGRGLRKELKDDSSYDGISFSTNEETIVIEQKRLSLEEMKSYTKRLPHVILKKLLPDEIEEETFNLCYKYRTYNADVLLNKTSFSKAKITAIKGIISRKEEIKKEFLQEENDKYIKLLDSAILIDENDRQVNCKVDDRTYRFVNKNYPGVIVTISRYKVLNIVRKLKENGMWIDDKNNNVDNINLFLVPLLKDTILSEIEVHAVRLTIINLLGNSLTETKAEGKGRI